MDNPKCSCGCRWSNHIENGHCRTRKLAGWDDAARQFTREDRCGCDRYRGPEPVRAATPARDLCPHEFIPGSRVCMICKAAVPVAAKR